MVAKGKSFEKQTELFFREFFEGIGYLVVEIRVQKAGTQYGFDVLVRILDENNVERKIHLECKDYSVSLDWKEFLDKIVQLDASAYVPDIFIGLSPKASVSNVNHSSLENLRTKLRFPIRLWSPDTKLEELFAINETVYPLIYGTAKIPTVDKIKLLKDYKVIIKALLDEKLLMGLTNKIIINCATKDPKEDKFLKINLDKKLDAVFDEKDPVRIEYHKLRCDYKIYLEELEDVNNELRTNIIRWQNDLRLMAERLTRKFKDDVNYTPKQFFNEFFTEADKRLYVFFNNEHYSGDVEKLLNGIIFELAAECPLDWKR